MANEELKRDENHVTVGGGLSSDSFTDVVMLRTDPSNQKLLVTLDSASSGAAISRPIAKRDQNHVPVCMAWDDTNKVLQEVLTDDLGQLLVDIEFT